VEVVSIRVDSSSLLVIREAHAVTVAREARANEGTVAPSHALSTADVVLVSRAVDGGGFVRHCTPVRGHDTGTVCVGTKQVIRDGQQLLGDRTTSLRQCDTA
jgi:hypothetical protein